MAALQIMIFTIGGCQGCELLVFGSLAVSRLDYDQYLTFRVVVASVTPQWSKNVGVWWPLTPL